MRAATASEVVVPLWRQPDFRRFWVAREVSIAGTLVTAVALPVLVYRLTGDRSRVPSVEGLVPPAPSDMQ